MEITKLLMEGLSSIQTNHLRHLNDFVEAQVKFYAECHATMQEMQRELARLEKEISEHLFGGTLIDFSLSLSPLCLLCLFVFP